MAPRSNRARAVLIGVVLFLVVVLWYSSQAREARNLSTYGTSKTGHYATDAKSPKGAAGVLDDDAVVAEAMKARLKAAKEVVDQGKEKMKPVVADAVEKVGQVSAKVGEAVGQVTAVAGGGEKEKSAEDEKVEEDREVEVELNSILKRSPVIIFSKSYCPYSMKAKDILLDRYDISPAPFVVELDLHPLGPKLQDKLGVMTGRRTVPNVLVTGKSIGGGDDIAALAESHELADKIKSLTGKQMQKVEERT